MPPPKATLLAAGLAALLAGCAPTQAAGPDRTVQIALSEYRITPQKLTAAAGPLDLVVHNFGRLAHNLALTQGGHVTAETAPIRPGSSATLQLDLTRGSYVIASTLFDDQSLGAYATLIVTAR